MNSAISEMVERNTIRLSNLIPHTLPFLEPVSVLALSHCGGCKPQRRSVSETCQEGCNLENVASFLRKDEKVLKGTFLCM